MAQNKGICQEQFSDPYPIAIQCASIYELISQNTPSLSCRDIQEEQIRPGVLWAYLDGASDAQDRCGAGIIIHINNHRFIKALVGIGTGSNNFEN